MVEAYLRAFLNWKPNDRARLYPMANSVYNNTKNVITDHTPFKLHYGFQHRVLFKENVNSAPDPT